MPIDETELLVQIRQPLGDELNWTDFLRVPFTHHVIILRKVKDLEERAFYIHMCASRAWNKYALEDFIKQDLFELMTTLVKMPDLLIYVRASVPTLVAQIQKRARGYEQQMKLDYLQGLNDKYENWIKDYKGKLLIVEGDKIKFGDNPEDFRWITDRIDAELFGLFPFESEQKTGKEI